MGKWNASFKLRGKRISSTIKRPADVKVRPVLILHFVSYLIINMTVSQWVNVVSITQWHSHFEFGTISAYSGFTQFSSKSFTGNRWLCGFEGVAATTHNRKRTFCIRSKKYCFSSEIYLSDLLSLASLLGILFIPVLRCLGILERLLFSFPLSHSLSDVRSMSLLGFRTITTEKAELLDLSSAGTWANIGEIFILHIHIQKTCWMGKIWVNNNNQEWTMSLSTSEMFQTDVFGAFLSNHHCCLHHV